MERMAEVVEKLTQLQGERTDAEMAALLGCSRSHWAHIKAGRKHFTLARLQQVCRAFPDVWPEVAAEMTGQEAKAS